MGKGEVRLQGPTVVLRDKATPARWYKYILVGDEIIIVRPRTLRIVAVIEA
jgi:hypothetical protein